MLRIIHRLLTPTAKKSAIFYAGSFALSIGNYLFHLLLLRLLAPEIYGEFLSYISFLYLITIPTETIFTVVTKYVADYYGRHDSKSINRFFYLMLYQFVLPSAILSILIIFSSPWLAGAFKAHTTAFVVLGINTIITFFGAIVKSYLLAFQEYIFNVIVGFVEVVLKISLAYLFITQGAGATGGVAGILLSGIIGTIIVLIKIKPSIYPRLSIPQNLNLKLGNFFTYSLILSAGTLSLMSTDILLVRYFFTPHTSGIYAALSILTRMIFFGLAPLSALILPIVAKRFSAGAPTKAVLYKLGIATLILGSIGTAIFSAIPNLIVRLLSGTEYQAVGSLLASATIPLLLFSLSRLVLMYCTAVGHQKANLILLIALLMQPILIYAFHQNLQQIISINLGIQICLLISLLFYYKIALKKVS